MTLANVMILVDQTAVPLALPSIMKDFNVGSQQVQWVLNGSLLPLAGRWYDRSGGRPPLIAGFATLLVSTLLLAWSVHQHAYLPLLPGLLLYGAGLALILTVNDPLSLDTVPESDHGQASGVAATAEQFGGAVGIAGLYLIFHASYIRWLDSDIARSPLPGLTAGAGDPVQERDHGGGEHWPEPQHFRPGAGTVSGAGPQRLGERLHRGLPRGQRGLPGGAVPDVPAGPQAATPAGRYRRDRTGGRGRGRYGCPGPEASQSSVTAAVQDCWAEPSGSPVNGSKYSPNCPAAIWPRESRRSASARAVQPSRTSDCHSSQLMTGQTGPRQ
jgi:hypothetical protein